MLKQIDFSSIIKIVAILETIKDFSRNVYGDTFDIYTFKDDIFNTVFAGRGEEMPDSVIMNEALSNIAPVVSKDRQKNLKTLRDLVIACLVEVENLDNGSLTFGEKYLFGQIAYDLQKRNGILWNHLDYAEDEESYFLDYLINSKEFVESEHPRQSDGKFKKKGSADESTGLKGDYTPQDVLKDVKKNEPKITKDFMKTAKKSGAELSGLDFRLKSEKSAIGKIGRERDEKPLKYKGKTDGQVLYSMWDLVRYTQVSSADKVVEQGMKTLRSLEKQGYRVVQIKNSWGNDKNPYKGINVKLISPDKQKIELQFNTPKNLEVKEEMHSWYEKAREEKDEDKAKEYENKMFEIAKNFEQVKDWEKFDLVGTSLGFKKTNPNAFTKAMHLAKKRLAPKNRWRVDIHSVNEYRKQDLYTTNNGSCVAITPDGNIISVCKMGGDERIGSDLMKEAVKMGGKKLDAFGQGLYKFYTKNGFEPVSWTPFDEKYAPDGWEKGRDKPEPVIFYKYTGKKTKLTYGEFLEKTQKSSDYDTAEKVRNGEMK